jgi:hypothetical protein
LAASAAAVVGQSVGSGRFYFGSFLALNGRAGGSLNRAGFAEGNLV